MKIKFSKPAEKTIGKMQSAVKKNIMNRILGLTRTPPRGDITTLEGYSDGRQRLRVGSNRIIFRYIDSVDENNKPECVLYIMDIGSRGDIYK
jgi:mRNA interferase RelE/StbE